MRRWIWVLAVIMVVGLGVAHADTESCLPNDLAVNQANNKQSFTITNSVAVKVVDENKKRCQLLIVNRGTADASCLPAWQGAPTASAGLVIAGGEQLAQNTSGRGAWYCIAVSSNPTTLLVLEELPNVP